MKKYILFLVLLGIVKQGLTGENPFMKHYGIAEGLLTHTIYHVSQDSAGFLWFSTDAGLVKYNGTFFQNFRKRDGLTDKDILRTQEDSHGRVWIFSFNGNIHYFGQNKIFNRVNTGFLEQIAYRDFTLGFFENKEGTLFFYNSHGLIYSLDKKNQVKNYHYPSMGRIFYITRTTDGKILYVAQAGLFIADDFESAPVLRFPMEIMNVFQTDGDHFLVWLSSGDFVQFRNEKQQQWIASPLKGKKIITAFIDHSGLLWAGTFENGVYCCDGDKILFTLPVLQSRMILQDRDENIWITSMTEGIYKIQPGFTFVRFFPAPGSEEAGITSLCNKAGDEVWLSDGKSVLYYSKGEIHPFVQEVDQLFIDALTEFRGELLAGKKDGALYAIGLRQSAGGENEGNVKPGKIRMFNPFFKGFSVSNDTSELCLQYINDLFFYGGQNPVDPLIVKGNERIFFTYYNRRNQPIICQGSSILVLKEDSLRICDELQPFAGKRVDDHVLISPDQEILNIDGDSLWLVTDKGLFNLTRRMNNTTDYPVVRLYYHGPHLYFATRNQVFRCEVPAVYTAEKEIQVQIIPTRFNSIHDILICNDTLFIGSGDGLTLIPPDEFNRIRRNVPVPYLTQVQAKEKTLNLFEKEIILKGNNTLHLDFDAINYSGSPALFTYKLDGLEKKWNTGPETSVVYQNLSPGDYVFRLRAGSIGTELSDEAIVHFVIKPALYQQWWFLAACLVMIMVLIYFGSRFYIRRLKKNQEVKAKLITYEQKALQSMMNPHFIFNSLGSIQNYLLQNKSNEASLYLSQFARLIRQNLNSANVAFISIEDETDRLMNYLSLEKLRLDDKFDFLIKVDEKLHSDEVMIPSMVIQPFVENAVWHGISTMEGKGQINIFISGLTDDSLLVTIEDDGIGIEESSRYFSKPDHVSIGMETTRKRLNLICKQYKLKFEITYHEAYPGRPMPGTRVKFNLPYNLSFE